MFIARGFQKDSYTGTKEIVKMNIFRRLYLCMWKHFIFWNMKWVPLYWWYILVCLNHSQLFLFLPYFCLAFNFFFSPEHFWTWFMAVQVTESLKLGVSSMIAFFFFLYKHHHIPHPVAIVFQCWYYIPGDSQKIIVHLMKGQFPFLLIIKLYLF